MQNNFWCFSWMLKSVKCGRYAWIQSIGSKIGVEITRIDEAGKLTFRQKAYAQLYFVPWHVFIWLKIPAVHFMYGAVPTHEILPPAQPWVRLQYLIHTALPKKMPFSDFSSRVKTRLTPIVVIRRQQIRVVTKLIFLYDILIQVIIEPLNFLFLSPLIKPLRVPPTTNPINQIPLLFHKWGIVFVENNRMNSTVFGRQVVFFSILFRVERGIALNRKLQWSLFRVVDWNRFGLECLLLVDSTAHTALVHFLTGYVILIKFILLFWFCLIRFYLL